MNKKSGSTGSVPKIRRCDICKKQWSTKYSLFAHRKIHRPKSDFKCSFCDFITNFKMVLFRHIRSRHTQERPYKCSEPNCNLSFSDKSPLQRHKLVHQKDESLFKYKCTVCPYKTKQEYNLKQHMRTHSSVTEFSCDLCPYRSNNTSNVVRHRKTVHLSWKRYQCGKPGCNFGCGRKSSLNKHELTHHVIKKEESKIKFKFSCDLCPFRTNRKRDLKNHVKLDHFLEKPHKCSQPNCNYAFKAKWELNLHKKVHSGDKPHSCPFSDCTFKTKNNLRNHERIHREEKPFKCFFCGFKTKQSRYLNQHIRKHTGETPYPCPHCSYRGKEAGNLAKHLKRCNLKKSRMTVLNKIDDSSPTLSLQCKARYCEYSTTFHSSMASHYNVVHKLREWS